MSSLLRSYLKISLPTLFKRSYSREGKLAESLLPKENILVMAGAGLSTASGIPDFRTPGSGLYSNLKKYDIPYPEALFEIGFFLENPKPFLALAKELYPSQKYKPNLGHYFIRMLNEKKKLLRLYTQNIDGLERMSGLPQSKLVEAHGTFATASCTKCSMPQDPDNTRMAIMNGEVVKCFNVTCQGLVKPDIVFFHENLPDGFKQYKEDVKVTDCLIVIGTSLTVSPFSQIVDEVSDGVPRLLINREKVGTFGWRQSDIILEGDISVSIQKLAAILGWEEDLLHLSVRDRKITVHH